MVQIDILSTTSSDEMELFNAKRVPLSSKKAVELEDSDSSSDSSSSASSTSLSDGSSSDSSTTKRKIPSSASKALINPYVKSSKEETPLVVLSALSGDQKQPSTMSEPFPNMGACQTPEVDSTPTRSPDSSPVRSEVILQSIPNSSASESLGEKLPNSHDFVENGNDFPWLDPDEEDTTPRKEDPVLEGKAAPILSDCPSDLRGEDSPKRDSCEAVDGHQSYIPRHQHHDDMPASAAEASPFRQGRVSEVDPSLYAPLPYKERSKPLVHYLSAQNRPMHIRKKLPIRQFFSSPANLLWKSKFDTFNHLQSEVASVLAYSNDSIVVSAPTGAGKTCLFEMAMAKLFSVALNSNGRTQNGIAQQLPKHRKIVYIAPSKALCDERFEDWSRRFSDMHLGIQCAMITGDAEPGECYRAMATAHVILTTPEKWDSVTRRWTENFFLIASVKLLMIDEVHLLGDSNRGCCLESVVCRMKTVFRATQNMQPTQEQINSSSYANTTPDAITSFLRIVAVSATLPNVSDIAAFLDANETFAFDASFRPVPLAVHTMGFRGNDKNQFMFNKYLNNRVPDLIERFSKGKPTIVFCHTKKECELLAAELSVVKGIGREGDRGCIAVAGQTRIKSLQKVLYRGIGYHHAGLEAGDRKVVEKAFGNSIRILCATSTLAMGVNLPAHLVIIKGTLAWRGAAEGYADIDTGTMLQMMGRAGRPGFDTEGTAVIMTDEESKRRYDRLSGGLEVVESQMSAKLIACLNSEISQRVITTFSDAVNWMKGTFYFVRARSNPATYGLHGEPGSLDSAFAKLVGESLRELDDDGIISVNKKNGAVLPLAGSVVMSSHLVEHSAMKKIVGLPFDATQSQLLTVIAEFDGLHRPVRRSEKKVLNQLHKTIRYKLDGPASKVRVQEPWQKAFVLLQAAVGQQCLEDYTLRQEMSLMVDFAARMLVAIEEFSAEGSMHGQVALQSLRLRRSFSTFLWGTGDGVLNQLTGVGAEATAKLRFNKILSFADTLAATEEEIERAAGKPPPFGKGLRGAVSKIMRNTLQISAYVNTTERRLMCKLSRRTIPGVPLLRDSEASEGDIVKYSLIAYSDRPGGSMQYLSRVYPDREYQCALPEMYGKVFISLVANLVGLDEKVVLEGNTDVISSRYTFLPALDAPKSESTSQASVVKQKQQTLHDAMVGTQDVRMRRRPTNLAKYAPGTRDCPRHDKVPQPPLPSTASTERSRSRVHRPPLAATTNKQPAVTPSPQSAYAVNAGQKKRAEPDRSEYQRSELIPMSTDSKRAKSHNRSTWNKEKQEQRNFQQSAFVAERENPFSRFKFDPNDAESNLEALASSHAHQQQPNCIIPPEVLAQLPNRLRMDRETVAHAPFGTRNKSRASSRFGTGRPKRCRSTHIMSNHDILQMKAQEQQRLCFPSATTPVPVSSYGAQYGSFTGRQQMLQDPNNYLPPSMGPLPVQHLHQDQSWGSEWHSPFTGQWVNQIQMEQSQTVPDPWYGFDSEAATPSQCFNNGLAYVQQNQCSQPPMVHQYGGILGRQHPYSHLAWSPYQGRQQQELPLVSGNAVDASFSHDPQAASPFVQHHQEDEDQLLDDAFF